MTIGPIKHQQTFNFIGFATLDHITVLRSLIWWNDINLCKKKYNRFSFYMNRIMIEPSLQLGEKCMFHLFDTYETRHFSSMVQIKNRRKIHVKIKENVWNIRRKDKCRALKNRIKSELGMNRLNLLLFHLTKPSKKRSIRKWKVKVWMESPSNILNAFSCRQRRNSKNERKDGRKYESPAITL